MRILRLYYLLPPIKGGMEKHVYFLTKFQNIENSATVFFNQGNAITYKDKKILPIVKFYKIRPLFIGVFLFYIFTVIKLLIRKKQFDVIHIHGDWSSLVFIGVLKKLTGAKKIIYTNHDTITNNFQHRKLLPLGLKNVDLIFTTGYESSCVIKKFFPEKKIIFQHSGVNDVFYNSSIKKFANERFIVVTVANLVPKKNINLILEIAIDLPEIEFFIVGDGPERVILQNTILQNNLKNVKLFGFKSAEEIKKIYDESDCFLLTSFAEGTPTSALEAMTSGLPILTSNAGGINNIITDGVNGYVIHNFEKQNYVNKLKLIKDNIELRKKIYCNNKDISENFKWEIVAERITVLTKECFYEKS